MWITILVFILILGFLVLVHELGHFLSARKLGIGVEEFGLGLPPKIFGWKKNGIVYSLNAIPLGGFVKIKGEDGEGKEDKDSFANRPIWQRLIVLISGVSMNFVAAWILLIILFGVGMPQGAEYRMQPQSPLLATINGSKAVVAYTRQIGEAFGGMARDIWQGRGIGQNLGGPIAIAAATNDVLDYGWPYVLLFAAVLSINLAIINILPFPALDGGRILFLIIEKIRGKPSKQQVEDYLHKIGFALLMLLAVFITYHDIVRFGSRIWRTLAG